MSSRKQKSGATVLPVIYFVAMTTIILHGHLGALYPREIKVQANSAAEALQSLALIPELRQRDGTRHLVQVDNFESADALYDKRDIDVLHVRPVMSGAGRGGVGQVIIGVVMIAVAIYTGGAGLTLFGTTISGGTMMMGGAMMVLGGVLQMLAPQPNLNASDQERSRYLGSGRNTVGIGTRIPMIYGRRKAYGHYISFDIDASVFDSAPAEWYSSSFTNNGDLTNSAAPVADPLQPPGVVDNQPTAFYTGFTSALSLLDIYFGEINFTPTQLQKGNWNISFSTGEVIRVEVVDTGRVTSAVVHSIKPSNLPPLGTPIVFTRNYG
jgi:predicted phage tail protein